MKESAISRAEALLEKMTLEEKVAQMIQVPYAHVGREKALEWAAMGAGSFLHVLGDDAREVQQAALNSRLGIPVIFGIDAVRGHALNENATIMPTQLALACSWDPELVREVGAVTAREVATDGLHWTFSPLLCLSRDPRWGRVNETFGEDPYLTGELASAIIRGYQGEDLSADDSILACAKHYYAYGEAVGARDACSSEITYRKAREVFLPPFKKAVEAGCATFMTAYGAIDGTPFTIDAKSLKGILRDEMGFDGFVVTDWDNVASLVSNQKVAADLEEASLLAAEAGNDMIMTTTAFYEAVVKLVREGRLKESVIDNAVRHILTIKFRMNLFEKPEKKGVPGCIGCDAHHEIALKAARHGVTLTKNNGVLPLKKETKIALIGGNADDIRAQYGDWTYFTHPLPDENREGKRPYVTVREGFEALSGNTVWERGCGPVASEKDDLKAALAIAEKAEVIVHVVGDEISQIGEQKDRADLSLSGSQSELNRLLAETGKPLVTVLLSSKPLAIPEETKQSAAVVIAFGAGMYAGQAIAEAVYGDINPSGRLPISFPYHSGQIPVYYNQLPGWHAKSYCDQPETPLFAFGEGLSYTSFNYDNLRMDTETMTASVQVTNTGTLEGLETVQVYFHDCVSSVMTPVKQLIAFKQVLLAPGESRNISFALNRMDFSLVNRKEQHVTEPGEFILMVGHSSKSEDLLHVSFTL